MMDDYKSIHITNDAAHISLPDWSTPSCLTAAR